MTRKKNTKAEYSACISASPCSLLVLYVLLGQVLHVEDNFESALEQMFSMGICLKFNPKSLTLILQLVGKRLNQHNLFHLLF